MKWHDKFEIANNSNSQSHEEAFGNPYGVGENYLDDLSEKSGDRKLKRGSSVPLEASDRFHRATTYDKFLGGLEIHAGREYFGGLVRMSQAQYLKFTQTLEILQIVYTVAQMLYFFICESDVGGINIIMNFLSSYLILCNCLPILLVWKTRIVYDKIESDNLSTSVFSSGVHNHYYHVIYNCQNIFIGISVCRITIFLFLVVIFLMQMSGNDLKYLALTSAINFEPLLCDRETLADFENELPSDLS